MCFYTVRQYSGCGHSREGIWFTCATPDTCEPEERPPPEEGGARSQPQRGTCPDCEQRFSGQQPRAPWQRDGRGGEDDWDDSRGRRQTGPGMGDPRYGGRFGGRDGDGYGPEDEDLDSPRGFGGRSPRFPPRGAGGRPRQGGRPDDDSQYGDEFVYGGMDRGRGRGCDWDAPRPNHDHRRRRRPIRPGYYKLDRDAGRLDVLETTDGNRYVQVRPRRNGGRQRYKRHEGTMCCVQ